METKSLRKAMFLFMAVWFVLESRQALAGDLHPMQTVNGLWEMEEWLDSLLHDEPTANLTLLDSSENDKDIAWFKSDIVDKYGFVKNKATDMWDQQGQFGKELGTPTFKAAADRALAFFKRNPNWAVTKVSKEFRKPANGKCLELLYITAARYLLVTHILWEQSGKKLIPCEINGKIVTIPPSFCYPEPYGSATCTSDYDVGLVGKDAGILTENFNNYFESARGFGKPSEKVFDTNVYAFTLEYSVPKMFSGLPPNFAASVARNEETVKFKMQELVSAYYKMFKYDKSFFDQLVETAKKTLKDTKDFKAWDEKIRKLHDKTPLDGEDVRLAHNKEYQRLVKEISKTGGYAKPAENLETLASALLYAAEAYHTRGAIRHVVGSVQLGLEDYNADKLPMMDLWVSMIENWGESIKEYNHGCFDADKKPVILEVCLVKMSKYMWRMLAAMRNLRTRIETEASKGQQVKPKTAGLVSFAGHRRHPEDQMRNWYEIYKKRGENQIPSEQDYISWFFERFGCSDVIVKKSLPLQCLSTMNSKVDVYNRKLAEIFSKKHPGPARDQENNERFYKSIEKAISKQLASTL